MHVCGIVAEYNPFHEGHAYHVTESRRISGADYVIAVMSDCFTQRGEPALCDPWTRTRMALAQGIDCVIALPCGYSLQPAEWFSMGGVHLLSSLGVVTHLAFGCESGNLQELSQLSELLNHEPEDLKVQIRQKLNQGLSWPRARAEAAAAYLNNPDAVTLLHGSNNILALCYLNALHTIIDCRIEPVAISRRGAAYLDPDIHHPMASATAIRRAWLQGDRQNIRPQTTYELLTSVPAVSPEQLAPFVLFALRQDHSLASRLPDMGEGLEQRIQKAAELPLQWHTLVDAIISKRYSVARVQRALCHVALNMTHQTTHLFRTQMPLFARIMGYRKKAAPLISAIHASAQCPVITRPARFVPQNTAQETLWSLEIQANDLYALLAHTPARRIYTERLITL